MLVSTPTYSPMIQLSRCGRKLFSASAGCQSTTRIETDCQRCTFGRRSHLRCFLFAKWTTRGWRHSLKVLRAIPDLNLVLLAGAERCCGGAGVYNLLEPEMSQGVLQEKLAHIRETGATVLATGNPGCQMQIGAGSHIEEMELQICHPVELLDISYARAGLYSEGSWAWREAQTTSRLGFLLPCSSSSACRDS